jgi:hypothetical protein
MVSALRYGHDHDAEVRWQVERRTGGRHDESEVLVDEWFVVPPCGAKVQHGQHVRGWIVHEICPVGIRLHVPACLHRPPLNVSVTFRASANVFRRQQQREQRSGVCILITRSHVQLYVRRFSSSTVQLLCATVLLGGFPRVGQLRWACGYARQRCIAAGGRRACAFQLCTYTSTFARVAAADAGRAKLMGHCSDRVEDPAAEEGFMRPKENVPRQIRKPSPRTTALFPAQLSRSVWQQGRDEK